MEGLEGLIHDEDAAMALSRLPPLLPTTDMGFEMKKRKQEQKQEQDQPAASLSEGPLVEILSRVPYRSLCRFKCVSKAWLALCSDPDIRKRSPPTLAGFFLWGFFIDNGGAHPNFCTLSGRGRPPVDPFLPYLHKSYERVIPKHCCGGLVLCKCWKQRHSQANEYDLVVCNPATGKWTELPPMPLDLLVRGNHYLGFDPAAPSSFLVFAHLWMFTELAIYSSDSGRWTTVESGWVNQCIPVGPSECAFLNDTMHMVTTESSIVTVDAEGKVWREIDVPRNMPDSSVYDSIGQSQGRLYAWWMDNSDTSICQLFVWALEDYSGPKWTLKHTVNVLGLFGRHLRGEGEYYKMFAIHPDCDLIFLTDRKDKTISYDMDSQEVHVIDTYEDFYDAEPYVPCFADWPSDSH